jgi:hypothetical protein
VIQEEKMTAKREQHEKSWCEADEAGAGGRYCERELTASSTSIFLLQEVSGAYGPLLKLKEE